MNGTGEQDDVLRVTVAAVVRGDNVPLSGPGRQTG